MRFVYFLFAMVVLCVMSAGSSYAAVNDADIIGIWLLDSDGGGVAADSSGNGHSGEIIGSINVVDGKFGNGFEFGGELSNHVSVPHDNALNLAEFTITYWCNMGASGAWQIPVLKVDHAVGGSRRNIDFQTPPAGGEVSAYFSQGENQWRGAIGSTVVSDEQWHHIAASYDLDTLLLYVDGVLDGEGVHGGDPDFMEDALMFGSGEIWPYLGVLDDIGIFSRALSVDEIAGIMNNGLSGALNITAVSATGKLTASWGGIKSSK